jgi:hypothetical protein
LTKTWIFFVFRLVVDGFFISPPLHHAARGVTIRAIHYGRQRPP